MSETCGPQPLALYKPSDPNMSFSKMSLASSVHDPTVAYAAGLIDGEGHIGIQCSKGKHYYAEITIGMSEKATPLLKAVMGRFGGTILQGRKKTKKWDGSVKWRIGGEEAYTFLREIYPYLMLKVHQVETVLELQELHHSLKQHPNGTRKWTDAAREKAAIMKNKIHEMNQKGPDAQSVGGGWYKPTPTLFGTWEKFSGPWPKAGMTLDGAFYPQPKWERRIAEIGSGLWLSTPTRGMSVRSKRFQGKNKLPTPAEFVKMWPTPQAFDAQRIHMNHETMDNTNRHARGGCSNLVERIGGKLNPTWVEWLMGWPLGWTDLEPLAMGRFRLWLQQHGGC